MIKNSAKIGAMVVILVILALCVFTNSFAQLKKIPKAEGKIVSVVIENQELITQILVAFFTNPEVQALLKQKGVNSALFANALQYEEEIKAVQKALAHTTLKQDIVNALSANDDLAKILQEAIKNKTVKMTI